MEALAAIALAGNVAQFLEYAIILVSKTPELLESTNGISKEVSKVEEIVRDVQHSLNRITLHPGRDGASSDKTLDDLTERCRAISSEIMPILKELKLRLPEDGIFRGAVVVTKTLFRMHKLKELAERLYNLRDQVSTHLIILIRQEQQELGLAMQKLTTSNQEVQAETDAKLRKIVDFLQEISKQLHDQQTEDRSGDPIKGEAEPAQPHELLKPRLMGRHLDDYVYNIKEWVERKQKSILKTLYFSQLKDRELAVAEAHKRTLEWIFSPNSSTDLVGWLRDQDGIFWITGKAGSGKSTLMKFLTQHSYTINHLRKWADKKSLIIAKHYFWSPGTSIQKSQEGLFRALLLQILTNRTDLIQTCCSNRWDAQYADSFNAWSCTELVRALESLGTWEEADYKICLFIDGLDEYDGDHAQLVSMISRISNSKNIKICASSRPWLSFSDAFENSPWKLYLHDLTYRDIQCFVQDNLHEDIRFCKLQRRDKVAADELASEITERASGVFLWVFLVVRSILRGLRNEDTISDLQRRLRELPVDLQEYFDRMLMTIESVYIKRVARLFLTMSYVQTSFPVITFYFMDFGDESISSQPLPFLRAWPAVDLDEAEALSTKKRQLIAQCRDLIFITPDPDAPVLFAERVGFLHRTVVDFLHTADIEAKLLQLAGDDFNPNKILLGANLSQARSLMHRHGLSYLRPYLKQWILGTLYYAHAIELSSGIAELDALDELDSIIMREFKQWGFSHAMEWLIDRPEITSFLTLACKCDLASYFSCKYPRCNARELDKLAPGWREALNIHLDSDFELRERVIAKNTVDEWRIGRMLELTREPAENNTSTTAGRMSGAQSTHLPKPAEPAEQQGATSPERRKRSRLSKAIDRLRRRD